MCPVCSCLPHHCGARGWPKQTIISCIKACAHVGYAIVGLGKAAQVGASPHPVLMWLMNVTVCTEAAWDGTVILRVKGCNLERAGIARHPYSPSAFLFPLQGWWTEHLMFPKFPIQRPQTTQQALRCFTAILEIITILQNHLNLPF